MSTDRMKIVVSSTDAWSPIIHTRSMTLEEAETHFGVITTNMAKPRRHPTTYLEDQRGTPTVLASRSITGVRYVPTTD